MTVMAAMRDASWRRNPGRACRYHALKRGQAMCGMRTLFVMEGALPLHEVPEPLRCRRPGCREAFEEAQVQRRTFSARDRHNTHVIARNVTPTANVYFQSVAAAKMQLPEEEEDA